MSRDYIKEYQELMEQKTSLKSELETIETMASEYEQEIFPKLFPNSKTIESSDGFKIKRDIVVCFNFKDLSQAQVLELEEAGIAIGEDYVINPLQLENLIKINKKWEDRDNAKEPLIYKVKKVHHSSLKKFMKENEHLKDSFPFKIIFKC